jgi:hypothetical protein
MPNPAKLTSQAQIGVLKALNQGAAAWIVGQSARTFRDSDAPRNTDGTYNAAALASWLRNGAVQSDDPLLAGSDSPNLERYRAAKADLAEMEAAERRWQLIDADQLAEWWTTEIASPIRRATDTLLARFGTDAAELITKAISKAEAAVENRKSVDD